MKQDKLGLGQRGEEIAVRTLREAGLSIIERNWRCPAGEVDIVATEQAPDYASGQTDALWLVLVEVRTRRSNAYASALQAFSVTKQRQLRRVAEIYVSRNHWCGPWRIDAMAVQLDGRGRKVEIEHIRHAVGG